MGPQLVSSRQHLFQRGDGESRVKGVGAGLASVAAGYSVVSHWIWTIFNSGGGVGGEKNPFYG